MKASGAKAYLVNTGWNGTGKRISIKDTRGIIDAIPVSYTHLELIPVGHEVLVQDAAQILLGAARLRTVVVGQVEVGDACLLYTSMNITMTT